MTATTTGCPPRTCSRRGFLQQAVATGGVAAVAPLLVPSRVLGAGAPSKRITVGFIGTGRQAVFANLPAFLRGPDAQVVALRTPWRI